MPRSRSLQPSQATKVYLSQANSAKLGLLTYDEHNPGRAKHGEVSRIVNLALEHFFSPDFQEFQTWKASKPASESASSEKSLKPES